MNLIEQECKDIIRDKGINLKSVIEYDVNGEVHSLSLEWIIESFMKASEESQQMFLSALKTAIATKDTGIDEFFEQMGQLILMTHLSDKLEV